MSVERFLFSLDFLISLFLSLGGQLLMLFSVETSSDIPCTRASTSPLIKGSQPGGIFCQLLVFTVKAWLGFCVSTITKLQCKHSLGFKPARTLSSAQDKLLLFFSFLNEICSLNCVLCASEDRLLLLPNVAGLHIVWLHPDCTADTHCCTDTVEEMAY